MVSDEIFQKVASTQDDTVDMEYFGHLRVRVRFLAFTLPGQELNLYEIVSVRNDFRVK